VFSERDPIKSYKTINQWRGNAMVKIYHGPPKQGYEYLLKEIDDSRLFFTEEQPVILDLNVLNYRRQRRQEKLRQEKKMLQNSIFAASIPEWMTKNCI
jgi:hypothetical protein